MTTTETKELDRDRELAAEFGRSRGFNEQDKRELTCLISNRRASERIRLVDQVVGWRVIMSCSRCGGRRDAVIPATVVPLLHYEERCHAPGCGGWMKIIHVYGREKPGAVAEGAREVAPSLDLNKPDPSTLAPPLGGLTGTQALIAERQLTHGVFTENTKTMQAVKELWRAAPNWGRLAPHQREALDMVAHKVGRILHGDPGFRDHWEDISGYVQRVIEALPEKKP